MGGASPKPPSMAMPPPAAHPPVLGSSTVDSSLKAQKARANTETFSADQTIATSPQGDLKTATTAKTTLLGQ